MIDVNKILSDHKEWILSHGVFGTRAILRGANLRSYDLSASTLIDADMSYADLRDAHLCGVNMGWVDLCSADLRGSNLRNANLRHSNLSNADLTGADLRGTCLDPESAVPVVTDYEILEAGLEIVGDRVYGLRTSESQYCGNTKYEPREDPYVATWFSVDTSTSCHPGIYLASEEWLSANYPGLPVVRCYCLRSELVHAGDKWRCKRLWVVD